MVTFTSVETSFTLKKKLTMRRWIQALAVAESKKAGDIAFVFCTDQYLGAMNQKYLKHHTLTDIITFDYSEGDRLSGDIFISIERVRENAKKFHVPQDTELARVMAHGVLHLAGWSDKTKSDKVNMRKREDACLSMLPGM